MKHSILSLLTAATLALGCNQSPSTAMVVAVTSEVPVPEEVNELSIEVVTGGQARFTEVYTIIPQTDPLDSSRKTRLPGTITLTPSGNTDAPITVTVKAKLNNGDNRFVRKATARFVDEKQKLLRMPLRFACMDFPSVCTESETCKAGACVPADVDLEQTPDFDDKQVFGLAGACFDRTACGDSKFTVPIAEVFAASTADQCEVSLDDLAARVPADKTPEEREQIAGDIRKGKINFGFVWAANKTGKWTVVDQDPEEGWTFADAQRSRVKLSKGLCDVVRGKVKAPDGSPLFTKAIVNTACEPKPSLTPQCAAP